MNHIVAWLNPNPMVIVDRCDNNKPPLRLDLTARPTEPQLGFHFGAPRHWSGARWSRGRGGQDSKSGFHLPALANKRHSSYPKLLSPPI